MISLEQLTAVFPLGQHSLKRERKLQRKAFLRNGESYSHSGDLIRDLDLAVPEVSMWGFISVHLSM